ncbi:ATP-binding cassette domain-containing protein, partial [Flavobacterium sp.]
EKLEIVGLTDRKDSKFKTYSLGMKQRLAIASALLNDPEILILDEPTNGLDPQGIIQVRDIIRFIASQGTTILLASHLLDEVEKVCSHVLVLRFGEILYNGKVDEMTSKSNYFELQSDNNNLIIDLLKNNFTVDTISEVDGKIEVYFNQELEASTLNRFLVEKGIYLNHLVKRKLSLENQFLALTNQNNS